MPKRGIVFSRSDEAVVEQVHDGAKAIGDLGLGEVTSGQRQNTDQEKDPILFVILVQVFSD